MKRRIERGYDFVQGFGCQTLAEWRRDVMRSPKMGATMKAMDWRYTGVVGGSAVMACVRQARWLAECECGGAERVDPDEPTFYCFSCGNVLLEGNLRPVIFPDDVEGIEAVLSVRPYPINRNWEPGETVEDLKRENCEHGVDITDD